MADSPFNVEEVKEQVDAQVSPAAPEGTPSHVDVHEVHVTTDEVILDPNAENAVQVPDEGRGDARTPIHSYAEGAKTPEEAFADKDNEVKSNDDTVAEDAPGSDE